MDSTPTTSTASASPARIWTRADERACMDEEHCFCTV